MHHYILKKFLIILCKCCGEFTSILAISKKNIFNKLYLFNHTIKCIANSWYQNLKQIGWYQLRKKSSLYKELLFNHINKFLIFYKLIINTISYINSITKIQIIWSINSITTHSFRSNHIRLIHSIWMRVIICSVVIYSINLT